MLSRYLTAKGAERKVWDESSSALERGIEVPTDIKGVPDEQELLCGNNCEILFVQIPKIMFIGQIYPRERLGTAQLFVGVARNDVTVNL